MVISSLVADAPGASDPISGLLVYGPLGILVVLFVLGLIVPKPVLDRAVKERDDALAYARKLEEAFRETYVPLTERNNEATREVIHVLTEFRVGQGAPPRRRTPPAKS